MSGTNETEAQQDSGTSTSDLPINQETLQHIMNHISFMEHVIRFNNPGLTGLTFEVLFDEETNNWEVSWMVEDGEKLGVLPASLAAIEAMPRVEEEEGGEGDCVICLEGIKVGCVVKEMPCKHRRFHEECLVKWLRINGTCPICRYIVLPPMELSNGGGLENDS